MRAWPFLYMNYVLQYVNGHAVHLEIFPTDKLDMTVIYSKWTFILLNCLNRNRLFVILNHPYGKAVFVRISDEYAVNILRTVIVRYIFTSCRKYPANKVGLTKK